MAVDKGFERTSEANLTNVTGNLCVPTAFFEFKDFNSFSTSPKLLEYYERNHYHKKIWNSPLILG